MASRKEKPFSWSIFGLGLVSIVTGALLGKKAKTAINETGVPGASIGRVKIVRGHVSGPNGFSYTLTNNDKLWLGRAISGEVDYRSQPGMSAVAWALVQNFVLVRRSQRFATFVDLLRAYAQPLSAAWADPNSSKCQNNPQLCTTRLIERRLAIQSTPWDRLPIEIRLFVEDFMAGLVQNPIPEMVDYAAFTFDGQQTTIAGNNFGTQPWRNLV